MDHERNKLRTQLNGHRSLLSPQQQRHASQIICHQVMKTLLFLNSKRLAIYFANNGEVDTFCLLTKALSMQKMCYFPILHPIKHNQMWFGRYEPGDRLKKNHYGILEPDPIHSQLIAPWSLDLVITPLVAFDEEGNRLGMGGGFYDRTFSFLKHKNSSKPKLFGLAYEFQRVTKLKKYTWDIPLNGVFTEKNSYIFIP